MKSEKNNKHKDEVPPTLSDPHCLHSFSSLKLSLPSGASRVLDQLSETKETSTLLKPELRKSP